GHHSDRTAAPARPFERGIPRSSESAAAASRAGPIAESTVRRALIACFAMLLAGVAEAATIKVLCDGPLEPALPAVAEAFRKKAGHQVEFAFAPSPVIQKRIMGGESADVVIVQPDVLAELAAKGKVDPGDHPAFGRIGIGLAARASAPSRDI